MDLNSSIQEAASKEPKNRLLSVPIHGLICLKVLANEDTLLRTHCCRHKCFPVCPRAQHLLRTQIWCPGHKNVSDFVQKHFVSATNVSQFTRARKRHEQQCFRNSVSSFATALKKRQIRFRIQLRIQSWIFLKKRTLSFSLLRIEVFRHFSVETNQP